MAALREVTDTSVPATHAARNPRKPRTRKTPAPSLLSAADLLPSTLPLLLPKGPTPLHLLDSLSPAELERERAEAWEQLRDWAFRLEAITALQNPTFCAAHVHTEMLRAAASIHELSGLVPTMPGGEMLPCPA